MAELPFGRGKKFGGGMGKALDAIVGGGSGPNIFPDPTTALAAFANTLPGQSGNRNPIRGDGYFGVDLGLGKRFIMPWKESHSLQFRAEAFDVSNTVRFDTNFVTASNISLSLGSPNTWGNYAEVVTTPRVLQFSYSSGLHRPPSGS